MPPMHTRQQLATDLAALGVAAGDMLMVHSSCRAIGPVLGGPDGIIAALLAAVGHEGTLAAYLDWDADWEDFVDSEGRTLPPWRDAALPFDPARTRAARAVGVLPECLRTTPGACRSGNPGASVAALGARAAWLTADHPLDYGYGLGTPLARLVAAQGKVLLLGAPLDTVTLVHHAEHLAHLPGKRVRRVEVPFATADGGCNWCWLEEYDTADPVVDSLPEDFIARIMADFLVAGHGRQGQVGSAACVLAEAPALLAFAIAWLERHAG
jgi:aminoglycoside 3-N-acetyltransferase